MSMDMNKLLQQAQQMQEEMQKASSALGLPLGDLAKPD